VLGHSSKKPGRRLAGLALLATVGLVFAARPWSGTADRQGSSTWPRADRGWPVEARELTSFALLRTPPEGLPGAVRRSLRGTAHQMRWHLAQRLPTQLRSPFWLVPGPGVVCLVQWERPVAASFCPTVQAALEHGVAGVFIRVPSAPWFGTPGRRLIVGVAPERARQIFVYTSGSVRAVPVRAEGVFMLSDSIAAPPDLLAVR
jgi:hypothetical protein